MKFLVNTFSSTGHVNSVGPIVAELRVRGHEVVWLTGKGARQAVEEFGAHFVTSEHALDWHARPLVPDAGSHGLDAAVSLCRGIYVDSFAGLVQDLRSILAWFTADAIVTDMGNHGAAALHDMGGPIYCSVFHVPACHWNHNPDSILHALVGDDDVAPFSYWIGTSQHWTALKPLLEREREKFELPPLPTNFLFKDLAVSPFLNLATTTTSVEFPEQLNEPQSWKIGPVFAGQGSYDATAWLGLVEKSPFVIHVTQGTFNPDTMDSKNLIEPTFEAFSRADDLLVIATGAGLHARYAAGEFPSNVYCEDFIPHAQLLPHVNVMITNAGLGGVLAALKDGVPLVCAGRGQDKADVSDLVGWRRFGVNLNTNFPTPTQIFEAVRTIRDNKEFLERVKEIQDDFTRHDAPRTASDLLERLVRTKQPVLKPEKELGAFHWNREEILGLDRRIANFFLDHVHATPHSTAVEAHDGCMTYLELHEAALIVSHALASLSVGRGDMIPICFSKSKDVITAMLALLYCRAAFVPLDPSNPPARLLQILDGIKPKIVLSSPEHQQTLSMVATRVVVLRDGVRLVVGHSRTDVNSMLSDHQTWSLGGTETDRAPDLDDSDVTKNGLYERTDAQHDNASDVAYVIFTSGSTGQPKGVVIDDRAVCTSLATQCARFGFDRSSRMLQCMSLSFDGALLEILGMLMSGGCICLPTEEERFSDLVGCMRHMRVNTALLTPSLARFVTPQSLPELKTLLIAGEPLRPENVLTWAVRAKVFNVYGPTEASIASTAYLLDSPSSAHDIIGTALACHVWVVDQNDPEKPLPKGEVGELLVEGPILARGYLHDEEKTRRAFVSPSWLTRFRKRDDVRAYRTGDLVRIDAENRVRYIERKDMQVKLRGLRIEIGEIEHHLTATISEELTSTALVPRLGRYSGKLVGAIMPCSSPKMFSDDDAIGDDFLEEGTMLEIESIRERLKENLPPYMVPSTFVRLKALPIRISGKLDRGRITNLIESLPDYDTLTKSEKTQNRPNITDAERMMETALLELFAASPDSLDLDLTFKQLGGDSILAMAAAMRLKSYGLKIKYSDLIGDKSLSWIANGCAKLGEENTNPSSTFVKHEIQEATARAAEVLNSNKASEIGGNISTVGLTPIQHIYFETLQWPRRFHSSQFLRVKSLACKDVLQSISRLVERHDMLRARFDRYDGTWQQRIEPISDRAYALSTHRDVPGSGMTHVIAGAHESIDIVNGPVFAAVIFTDARDDVEYIHLIAHHLVVDMVSWHIIMRELDASLCGHRPVNGEPTTYLAWQQRQAEHGKALRPEGLLPAVIPPAPVAYWGGTYTSESLLGASSDRNSLKDMTSEIFELFPDTTDHLWKRCAESPSLQVVDVLLACFLSSFIKAFPDRQDVCVWNQVHGRDGVWDDDIDIEGTVGWFNIFIPIRINDTFVGRTNEVDALVEFVNGYRASIPAHGLPYFTSRTFNTQAREEARSHMPMEVVFNYAGRSAASGNAYQAFTPVSLNLLGKGVREIDPEFKLTHVLDIMVEVGVKGELRCRLSFDRRIAHQDELKNCWQGFEAALITWAEGAF